MDVIDKSNLKKVFSKYLFEVFGNNKESTNKINLKNVFSTLEVNKKSVEIIERKIYNYKDITFSNDFSEIKFKTTKVRNNFINELYSELYSNSKNSIFSLLLAYLGYIEFKNVNKLSEKIFKVGLNAKNEKFIDFINDFKKENNDNKKMQTNNKEQSQIIEKLTKEYNSYYQDKVTECKENLKTILENDELGKQVIDYKLRKLDISSLLKFSEKNIYLEKNLPGIILSLLPKGSIYENGNFYDKKGKIINKINLTASECQNLFCSGKTKQLYDKLSSIMIKNVSLLERIVNSNNRAENEQYKIDIIEEKTKKRKIVFEERQKVFNDLILRKIKKYNTHIQSFTERIEAGSSHKSLLENKIQGMKNIIEILQSQNYSVKDINNLFNRVEKKFSEIISTAGIPNESEISNVNKLKKKIFLKMSQDFTLSATQFIDILELGYDLTKEDGEIKQSTVDEISNKLFEKIYLKDLNNVISSRIKGIDTELKNENLTQDQKNVLQSQKSELKNCLTVENKNKLIEILSANRLNDDNYNDLKRELYEKYVDSISKGEDLLKEVNTEKIPELISSIKNTVDVKILKKQRFDDYRKWLETTDYDEDTKRERMEALERAFETSKKFYDNMKKRDPSYAKTLEELQLDFLLNSDIFYMLKKEDTTTK